MSEPKRKRGRPPTPNRNRQMSYVIAHETHVALRQLAAHMGQPYTTIARAIVQRVLARADLITTTLPRPDGRNIQHLGLYLPAADHALIRDFAANLDTSPSCIVQTCLDVVLKARITTGG